MDVLYVVREGEFNEELRYSLRSLNNLPHDNVIVAGYVPSWIQNVVRVPVEQGQVNRHDGWTTKYINTRANMAAGIEHAGRNVILMNDDMYVTEPIGVIPQWTYGPIDVFLKFFNCTAERPASRYVEGELETFRWLVDKARVSYSLHSPFFFERDKMRTLLHDLPTVSPEWPHPLHLRTAYGNTYYDPELDIQVRDKKPPARKSPSVRLNGQYINSLRATEITTPFASSSDRTWESWIGYEIKKAFPVKCRYEV